MIALRWAIHLQIIYSRSWVW